LNNCTGTATMDQEERAGSYMALVRGKHVAVMIVIKTTVAYQGHRRVLKVESADGACGCYP